MFDAIISGFGTGVVLSCMLGTVFFALIQNSIDFGYKSGIFIALGVIISDIFFISAAMAGTSFLPDTPKMSFYSSFLGGILLVGLGGTNFFKKSTEIKTTKTHLGNALYYFGKGFLLNALNPVNFFFWVAIVAHLQTEKYFPFNLQVVFFAFCLLAIFCTEVGISFSASRLRKLFTPLLLQRFNQISGIVFVGFGIKLLYDAFVKYV
ncbi:MAG: LysE family transporter [Raineya sp.]|nr:LysE family translocator [Raineya sp.]MDW8297131.1 LysE family transporter [Raineya sp.]